MKWQSGSSDFQGDVSEAMRQMAERDNPQPEETYEDRIYKAAYEAEQSQAKAAEQAAEAEAQRTAREQTLAEKAARDAADEHRSDRSNYYFVAEEGHSPQQVVGKMYYTAKDGTTYLVQDGTRIYPKPIPVKNPPRRLTEDEEMKAAIERSRRSKRAASQLPF